jgi:hypothetical protein
MAQEMGAKLGEREILLPALRLSTPESLMAKQ